MLAKLGWPLDLEYIADRVDEWNAAICEKMGWTQYITTAEARQPGHPFRAGIAVGPARVFARVLSATCCGGRHVD